MQVPKQVRVGSPQLGRMALLAGILALLPLTGCADIFGAGFLNRFYYPVSGVAPTLDNAPGHVAVLFINNARFDTRLLDYLAATGANLGEAGTVLLPRVRARFNVTYTNGNTNVIEFIDGDTIVEGTDPEGGIVAVPPELNELPLTNVVAICDVSRIDPVQVEVFVPVTVTELQIVGNQNVITREVLNRFPPHFQLLEADAVDEDANVTLTQNFDIRQAPVLVNGVQCGAVVGFTISGTLAVPFEDFEGQTIPGYLNTDTAAEAANPGRFQFFTNVR